MTAQEHLAKASEEFKSDNDRRIQDHLKGLMHSRKQAFQEYLQRSRELNMFLDELGDGKVNPYNFVQPGMRY